MLLGYVWFVWLISLTIATSGTALWLYRNAVANRRSPQKQALIVAGGVAVFAVPALAMLIGTDIGCNADTGFHWHVNTPGVLLLSLVVAGAIGLGCLVTASGPARRRWLIPLALVGITVVGFGLETFLGVAAIAVNCDEGNPAYLFLQGGLALAVPASIVAVTIKLFPPWR